MSVSFYLRLSDYNGKSLNTTGQYDATATIVSGIIDPVSTQFLKLYAYSNDVMQTLNIGSQSTGAGAGRISFNPLSVSRMADGASPVLFQAAASGTPFKTAELFVTNQANAITMKYVYKMAAVKPVSWAGSNENVIEVLSFEYGGLLISVNQQQRDGTMNAGTFYGWNRVKNVRDNAPATSM